MHASSIRIIASSYDEDKYRCAEETIGSGRGERAVLFINTRSGRSRRSLFRIVEALRRTDIELESVHFDLQADRVTAALSRAHDQGIELVLAAGGDGTIGALAGHLINSEFILGVLPAGTSNDFARSLKVPMSIERAVHTIAAGHRTRVDVGAVNDHVFVHAATVGINTDFARIAQHLRGVLGRVSYPLAALEVYLNRRRIPVQLRTPDGERSFHGVEVAVVNAPVYGGPLELHVAAANLMDHRMSVLVIDDIKTSDVMRMLPVIFARRPLRDAGIENLRVTCATIHTEPPMDVTVDGEIGPVTPVEVKIIPAALSVCCPDEFLESARESGQ